MFAELSTTTLLAWHFAWHFLLPTIDLHRTFVDATAVDLHCGSALPDIRHHHDATQSLRLLMCDHPSQELTTVAETITIFTRSPTGNQGHHELTNSSFFYNLSTRTEEARLTTLLLGLN